MAGPGSWIVPLFPALLMLMIVALNHLITNQRNDRKLADETVRFRAALATELRALIDLYDTNLGLIARKADYILSTRSSVVVYKGNLGRLTLLLEPHAIARVVRAFARKDRSRGGGAFELQMRAHLSVRAGRGRARGVARDVRAGRARGRGGVRGVGGDAGGRGAR